MKKIILAAVFICSTFTQARQVTIDLPNLTTEDEVFFNFDGSITIINPQVFVKGEFYKVTQSDKGTSHGLCVAYNRTKAVSVYSESVYSGNSEEEKENNAVVMIDVEGSFTGFRKVKGAWQDWIEEITCK
jgi:hypothetical protein